MQVNYKDIELTNSQRKLLKKLKKHSLKESDFPKEDLEFFRKLKLVKCQNTNDAFYRSCERIYEITDNGLMYIRFFSKDRLRVWYPYIVSTIALILSIVSFINSIS